MAQIEELDGCAFLAFPEMGDFLRDELRGRFGISDSDLVWHGDLAMCENFSPSDDVSANAEASAGGAETSASGSAPYFCRTAMTKPFLLRFDSIGEAASALKSLQRNWAGYQFHFFRRAALIQEKLPYINLKTRDFPAKIPRSPVGLYTLLDEHTMLASCETASFLPAGKIEFNEDHENPPSRAYLKLWEALTMMQLLFGVELPKAGERCFDAGACPGGWTWVMTQLGCDVFAVDRSELAPALMANEHVTFRAHDAFTIEMADVGECDWLLSDVICYPERLYEWLQKWLSSGLARNVICTIKMQGEIDWKIVQKFAEIKNSKVLHLNYNKHELTFIHTK